MATLADLNKTLKEQNEILVNVTKSSDDTSKGVEKLAARLGDSLKKREEKLEREKSGGFLKTVQAGFAGGFSANLLGFGVPQLAAGLFGALGKVGRFGLLGLVGTYLGDAVGDYIESEGGSRELAAAAQRSITGGSIGLIFGRKGALIGAILGGLLTDENIKELETAAQKGKDKLEPELEKLEKNLEEFGLKIPTLTDVVNFATNKFNSGIKSINDTLDGNLEEATKGYGDLATTAGTFLAFFGPFKKFGIVLALAGASFDALAESFGGEVASAIAGVGLLGFTLRKKIASLLKGAGVDEDKIPKKPIKIGTVQKINGVNYEWKGAQWVAQSGQGPASGRIATKELAEQLTKQASKSALAPLGTFLRGFSRIFGITPTAALYSEELGGPRLDEDVLKESGLYAQGVRTLADLGEENMKIYQDAFAKMYGMQQQFGKPKSADIEVVYDKVDSNINALRQQIQDLNRSIFAPSIDARNQTFDQSQAAIVTADPHLSAMDPNLSVYSR